eukprot:650561-Rhodomonas_salina.13
MAGTWDCFGGRCLERGSDLRACVAQAALAVGQAARGRHELDQHPDARARTGVAAFASGSEYYNLCLFPDAVS